MDHSGKLRNRIAIVTGASSGLGRAICLSLASAGARVVCADVSPLPHKAEKALDSPQSTHSIIVDRYGPNAAIFVRCDVRVEEDIAAVVQSAVSFGGRLDIMINNAGVSKEVASPASATRIHETSTGDWDATQTVNLRGVWLGCKYAVGQFLAQDPLPPNTRGDRTRGRIVNVASVFGLKGFKRLPCYVPTKHAVVGLTRQVALDYATDRIHCNAVAPAFVKTAMIEAVSSTAKREKTLADIHPWRALGTSKDVADAVIFLCSNESEFVTGMTLSVDGGVAAQL